MSIKDGGYFYYLLAKIRLVKIKKFEVDVEKAINTQKS
jgi:hypothetical protein